jgi:hypothetical protein
VEDREVVHVPEGADAQAGQRRLRRPEEADVHPVDRDRRDQDDDGADQDQPRDHAEVGVAAGGQAAVDDLLDGDRHDHPSRRGDQCQGEGDRQAAAELRHHPEPAAQGGEGALAALVGGQERLLGGRGHAGTSACE